MKQVVFDPLFAGARPTSTFYWFFGMRSLESITGMEYLNTSEVVRMDDMFNRCYKLTSLNLEKFNMSKVTDLSEMFRSCSALQTIYVGDGWKMSEMALTSSHNVFKDCTSLVGGKGTAYDATHVDADYAHVDGGTDNPGYLSAGTMSYVCYTPDNTTLTFYHDNQRDSRPGRIYDLNVGINRVGWELDHTCSEVTNTVIDPSFADARPTTTYAWFYGMNKIDTIIGLEYLNTSEVTIMNWMFGHSNNLEHIDVSHFNTDKVNSMYAMFGDCEKLKTLDLSNWNTANVTDMDMMFSFCLELKTIYVGSGWNTDCVTESEHMFANNFLLVGGQGTAWDASNPRDKTYAHIDGGPDNPGYFTEKPAFIRGDVNGDVVVNIADVTALIDLLLGGGAISNPAADCNQDGNVNIADVTTLIDYLLSGTWPTPPQPANETFTVNGVSFTMIGVQGGTFTMGATPEQGDEVQDWEKPAHQVTLSSYSIGQTEVTQELWQAVMGSNPSAFTENPLRPVEHVSWDDCQTFINALNQLTGKTFRLPTEAEWEFAARGGNMSKGYMYAGSNELDEVAWFYDNSYDLNSDDPNYGTHAVATKAPNELGLYDMSGNVMEWCHDWYASYSSEAQINPTGPDSGPVRVYRGGAWNTLGRVCRVSLRADIIPSSPVNHLGLRLAL